LLVQTVPLTGSLIAFFRMISYAIHDNLNAILSTDTHVAIQARLDELGLTAAAKQYVGFLGW
jgi:hypothetical protein